MKNSLKDFIYLDDERVRSYIAQMDGGLQEKTEKKTTHGVKAGSSVKADGLTKLFMDTKVGADYAFQKSSSETSTLHHAAFELLSEKLNKAELVNSASEYGKPFSNIACHLRLIDYSVLARQLDQMGLLMPLFNKLSGKHATQKDNETKAQMKNMSKVVETLYGDAKILQLISLSRQEVVAQISLDDDLSLPVQSLFQASSNDVLPGTWQVFCIYEQAAPEIVIPTGENEISQALTMVSAQVAGLKVVISATADAPSVIPIAIYRELRN